jgi:hypothetical protein
MTLDEILVAIGAFIADDKTKAKEVAKALRAHAQCAPLAQELVNYGAGKKKTELDVEIAKLTRERDEANTERDEVKTSLEELKAKTPDVAAIEGKLKDQHAKKIKEKDDLIAEQGRTLKGALSRVQRERFVSQLSATHKVDADYAREVLATKYADRFQAADDGKVAVLQLGSTEAYDADSEDKAIELLAADVAKAVPARFVLTNADRGGGSGGGSGGGGAVVTQEKLVERQRLTGEYAL